MFELHSRPAIVPMIAFVEASILWPHAREEAMGEDTPREDAAARDHDVAREAMEVDRMEEVVRDLDDLGVFVDRCARDVLVPRGDAPMLDLSFLLQLGERVARLTAVDRLGRRVMK